MTFLVVGAPQADGADKLALRTGVGKAVPTGQGKGNSGAAHHARPGVLHVPGGVWGEPWPAECVVLSAS